MGCASAQCGPDMRPTEGFLDARGAIGLSVILIGAVVLVILVVLVLVALALIGENRKR